MSSWNHPKLFSTDIASGARVWFRQRKTDLSTALWVSFWLVILTAGDPDLIDAVIALIGRLAT